MALVEWRPFEEIGTLHEKINKLFDNVSGKEAKDESSFLPAVDIYTEGNNLVIEAEIPGIDKKDIDLKVEDNVLTIRGRKEFKKEEKGDNYYRVERSYGSFVRSFMIPDNIDKESIKAEYKKGVLKLILPKKPEAQSKSIPIEVQ
ncbi:MAG: Hsp20/alpha crystallin family protein [Epsilonproteobacteria bacterium]|nr:Hsp20/alpha crystallin family protein [Campylobacterota bacterium]